jgi:hypothetical protein
VCDSVRPGELVGPMWLQAVLRVGSRYAFLLRGCNEPPARSYEEVSRSCAHRRGIVFATVARQEKTVPEQSRRIGHAKKMIAAAIAAIALGAVGLVSHRQVHDGLAPMASASPETPPTAPSASPPPRPAAPPAAAPEVAVAEDYKCGLKRCMRCRFVLADKRLPVAQRDRYVCSGFPPTSGTANATFTGQIATIPGRQPREKEVRVALSLNADALAGKRAQFTCTGNGCGRGTIDISAKRALKILARPRPTVTDPYAREVAIALEPERCVVAGVEGCELRIVQGTIVVSAPLGH